jgi:hypothetical protein
MRDRDTPTDPQSRAAKSTDVVAADTGNMASALAQYGVRVVSEPIADRTSHTEPWRPTALSQVVTRGSALVMCSDQGIYQARIGLAQVLGLPLEKISTLILSPRHARERHLQSRDIAPESRRKLSEVLDENGNG